MVNDNDGRYPEEALTDDHMSQPVNACEVKGNTSENGKHVVL